MFWSTNWKCEVSLVSQKQTPSRHQTPNGPGGVNLSRSLPGFQLSSGLSLAMVCFQASFVNKGEAEPRFH